MKRLEESLLVLIIHLSSDICVDRMPYCLIQTISLLILMCKGSNYTSFLNFVSLSFKYRRPERDGVKQINRNTLL